LLAPKDAARIFAPPKQKRSVRLGVRTVDFHSTNRGSIPLRTTIKPISSTEMGFLHAGGRLWGMKTAYLAILGRFVDGSQLQCEPILPLSSRVNQLPHYCPHLAGVVAFCTSPGLFFRCCSRNQSKNAQLLEPGVFVKGSMVASNATA
jgi:hypothetical protein